MKVTDEQIIRRLQSSERFDKVRTKIHKLRRLVAGDVSVFDGCANSKTELEELYKGNVHRQFFDVMVTDIEEGRTNKLMQAVRQLVFSVSLTFPDVELDNADALQAQVNSLYIKDRIKYSAVPKKVRMATTDYVIGGPGCCFVGVRDGVPVVDYVDNLDVTWDLTASTFEEITWASWIMRDPLWKWLERFPRNKKLLALRSTDEPNMDKPVSVAVYYDRTGPDSGNEVYVLCSGSDNGYDAENILSRGKNPYHEVCGGYDRVCVPLVFMHYFDLPSTKISISPVEMMLSAQVALWEADKSIRDHVDIGCATREMEQDSYTEDSLEKWKDGDRGTILERKKGSAAMSVAGALDIPQGLVVYRNNSEQEIISQSGLNPYAGGNRVQGIGFASEVQAIQSNSGLVAGIVAKDVATFWQKIIARFLANGMLYDDEPLVIQMRDGDSVLEMAFDESDPIKDYLLPGADIVVSEDSLVYRSRREKIQDAAADLQQAVLVAQQFPNALPKAYEEYLRATGKKNVQEYMASQMAAGVGMTGEQVAPSPL